jgi:ribokinase
VTASVVVVGSVNVDLVVRVPSLPTPGETVSGGTFARALGGKGANQAAAAASLGARVRLVGLTGDDDFGRLAREDLRSRGVDVSTLGTSPNPTGVAAIVVDGAGENAIAVASGANHDLTGAWVVEQLARVADPHVVLLANLEVPDEAIAAAARVVAERGWRFVLDPAPVRPISPEVLARCDVLTPNEHEAGALGSTAELLAQGVGTVVLTRGADGADVLRAATAPWHQVAFPVDVVDTTGAGDAFNGALAWSLGEGRELLEAVRVATAAGALACRSVGARASLPDQGELDAALAGWEAAR